MDLPVVHPRAIEALHGSLRCGLGILGLRRRGHQERPVRFPSLTAVSGEPGLVRSTREPGGGTSPQPHVLTPREGGFFIDPRDSRFSQDPSQRSDESPQSCR